MGWWTSRLRMRLRRRSTRWYFSERETVYKLYIWRKISKLKPQPFTWTWTWTSPKFKFLAVAQQFVNCKPRIRVWSMLRFMGRQGGGWRQFWKCQYLKAHFIATPRLLSSSCFHFNRLCFKNQFWNETVVIDTNHTNLIEGLPATA